MLLISVAMGSTPLSTPKAPLGHHSRVGATKGNMMWTKFAPVAMLFGLLTALLLGSTSMAQAGPATWGCGTKPVNVLVCNTIFNGEPLTVTIRSPRVLTANELIKLENALINIEVNKIKITVVNVFRSFNPPIIITVDDVIVCYRGVCQ